MNIVQIAVSDVVIPENNIELSKQTIEGLKKVLEQYGENSMAPIFLDDERRLIGGFNRFFAMKECGLKTVRALVINPDMVEKIKAQQNVPLV